MRYSIPSIQAPVHHWAPTPGRNPVSAPGLALVLLQSMAVVNYSSPRVKNVLLLVELEGMFVVGQSP